MNFGNSRDRSAFAKVRKADVKKIDLTPRLSEKIFLRKCHVVDKNVSVMIIESFR